MGMVFVADSSCCNTTDVGRMCQKCRYLHDMMTATVKRAVAVTVNQTTPAPTQPQMTLAEITDDLTAVRNISQTAPPGTPALRSPRLKYSKGEGGNVVVNTAYGTEQPTKPTEPVRAVNVGGVAVKPLRQPTYNYRGRGG